MRPRCAAEAWNGLMSPSSEVGMGWIPRVPGTCKKGLFAVAEGPSTIVDGVKSKRWIYSHASSSASTRWNQRSGTH